MEELARLFNTALLSTRANPAPQQVPDLAAQMDALMDSQAYRSLLECVRDHALRMGISERQAAEELVVAFRGADRIWRHYLEREGLSRILERES